MLGISESPPTPLALTCALVAVAVALTLQGCKKPPDCEKYTISNGRLPPSHKGKPVVGTCDDGYEWDSDSPDIECNWVGRDCLKGTDGRTCQDVFKFGKPGTGLTSWPQCLAPNEVDKLKGVNTAKARAAAVAAKEKEKKAAEKHEEKKKAEKHEAEKEKEKKAAEKHEEKKKAEKHEAEKAKHDADEQNAEAEEDAEDASGSDGKGHHGLDDDDDPSSERRLSDTRVQESVSHAKKRAEADDKEGASKPDCDGAQPELPQFFKSALFKDACKKKKKKQKQAEKKTHGGTRGSKKGNATAAERLYEQNSPAVAAGAGFFQSSAIVGWASAAAIVAGGAIAVRRAAAAGRVTPTVFFDALPTSSDVEDATESAGAE